MRLARLLILMCFICLQLGCTQKTSEQIDKEHAAMQVIEDVKLPVRQFSQVYIIGPFDVNFHTNKHRDPGVTAHGSRGAISKLKYYVKDGALYISLAEGSHYINSSGVKRAKYHQVKLDINAPRLYTIYYKGEGILNGHHLNVSPFDLWVQNPKQTTLSGRIDLRNLVVWGKGVVKISGVRSKSLRVRIEGSSHVELKGEATLKSLDMNSNDGKGVFSLYWLKGKDLVIRAKGDADIEIAGRLSRIDGEFSGTTHFDAQHLKVKEAFIKTNDEAVADIAVKDYQHALARDKSDIYYHTLPDMRTGFMARNGSILDMRPDSLKMIQKELPYSD